MKFKKCIIYSFILNDTDNIDVLKEATSDKNNFKSKTLEENFPLFFLILNVNLIIITKKLKVY